MNAVPIRLLRQPGPMAARRWKSAETGASAAYRFELAPGRTLHEAIAGVLLPRGIASAALNICGGTLARLSYCLTAPQEGTNQVASYMPAVTMDETVTIVAAHATLGAEADGRPMIHCHVLATDASGKLFGGHVFPEETVIGAEAPVAFARALGGIAVRRLFDPETNFSVLQPALPGESDVAS